MESPVTVKLPTLEDPDFIQEVIGRVSPVSSDLEEFRGIPYGIVPGRWQHSHIRKQLPRDRFEAFSNGPKCPQASEPNNSGIYQLELEFPQDEEDELNCLNLFIIRPSAAALERHGIDPQTPLPTLVWIHGGGFGFGAATDPPWNPSQLALESLRLGKPCVFVAINYRVSTFGFGACTQMLEEQKSNNSIQGVNFGLRDQKVALTWVSLHISAFGGDPEKITIGGQSAGGCSVHVHALEAKYSPEVPLFRNAIIQSGAVGCIGPIGMQTGDNMWERVSREAGVETRNPVESLRSMRELSAKDVLQAYKRLGWIAMPIFDDKQTLNFAEVLRPLKIDLGFVHERPERNSARENHNVNVLIGQVDAEGVIWDGGIAQIADYEQLESLMKSKMTSPTVMRKIQELYHFNSTTPMAALRVELRRLLSEVRFGFPVHLAAQNFNDQWPTYPNMPTTHHSMSVESYRMLFGNPFEGPLKGISHHCVELIYLFNVVPEAFLKADVKESQAGQKIVVSNDGARKQIQEMWINFIAGRRTGIDGLVDPEKVILFETDRSSAVVDKSKHPYFQAEMERFQLISDSYRELLRFTSTFTDTKDFDQ